MSVIPTGSRSNYSLKPGDHINIYSRQENPTEVVLESNDGTKVRFNLIVGQRTEITAGNSPLKIILNPCNEDLVGIPPEVVS